MAASIGNRQQPEDSEMEQRNQRDRLRRRQPQNRVKSPAQQEMTRIPSQPSDPILGSADSRWRLHLRSMVRQQQNMVRKEQNLRRVRRYNLTSLSPTRPEAVPLKPLLPRKAGSQPATRLRPHLQSGSEIRSREQKLREAGGTPLPQNPDLGRGRRGRDQTETRTFQRLNPLPDPRNPGREHNQPRTMAAVPGSPPQVGTSGARPLKPGPTSQLSPNPRNRPSRRSQKRSLGPLVYAVRLLIVGIGIGAIAGTLLSALDPATQVAVKADETTKAQIQESPNEASNSPALTLHQEISPLKTQIQALVAQNSKLQPGLFIIDLDTGAYLDWEGHAPFSAASTIKVPILVAFFQDVDAGKIRLDEPLAIQPEMIAAGSGDLQYKPPGTQYTALEVATKMIAISDNTATNMLITRLGGAEALNQRFRSWGLTATAISNPLPDVEGTNITSPKDLATLMSIVNQGELVSLRSRDRLLDIMQQTVNNSLLPKGLGAGATIAHKTGDIGSLLADVGLVDMPTGKRYIVVAMVKRPHNDASAQQLIRQISRTAYDYFNQPQASPSTTSMPLGNTATISRAPTPGNTVN